MNTHMYSHVMLTDTIAILTSTCGENSVSGYSYMSIQFKAVNQRSTSNSSDSSGLHRVGFTIPGQGLSQP